MKSIRLCAEDLFGKFGFEDGDILCSLGIVSDPHDLLYHLVTKYLLPLLPIGVTLTFWTTCHNPCRMSDASEEDFPDLYYQVDLVYVDIPISTILEEDILLDGLKIQE